MDKELTKIEHNNKQLTHADSVDTESQPKVDEDLMLTTIDNPYNPKTDYVNWRIWDADQGYNTEEYLARLTDIPGDVDIDDEITINQLTTLAINEILEHDVLKIYMLV